MLPHPNTIKHYFSNVGNPGEISDCEDTMKLDFDKLANKDRYCKVLLDKIHIKTAVQYQGNQVIGF